jgi:restriction system protein
MGPHFSIYVNPVLLTLQEMGGAGVTSEVIDKVIERLKIPESEVEIMIPSGTQSRVRNQIQWARMYLTKGGFMDSKVRGTWKLTDKGMNAQLTEEEVIRLYKNVTTNFNTKEQALKQTGSKTKVVTEEAMDEEYHNDDLLKIIQRLSPSGFERLCKRLLTECGFINVEVTGRSGDNGIDGIGLLEVNDLVSFKVLFQCKRYKETVGPGMVRDFRGAMQGRVEKGIILTTGRFTKEARQEAKRDGVPPIELVDGDKLVDMFEKYELGLKPKTVYDIDLSFFEEFK